MKKNTPVKTKMSVKRLKEEMLKNDALITVMEGVLDRFKEKDQIIREYKDVIRALLFKLSEKKDLNINPSNIKTMVLVYEQKEELD